MLPKFKDQVAVSGKTYNVETMGSPTHVMINEFCYHVAQLGNSTFPAEVQERVRMLLERAKVAASADPNHRIDTDLPLKFAFKDGKTFRFDYMCGVSVMGVRVPVSVHPERGIAVFATKTRMGDSEPRTPNRSYKEDLRKAPMLLRRLGLTIPFDFKKMEVVRNIA